LGDGAINPYQESHCVYLSLANNGKSTVANENAR
jgi:hypothetical protein